MQDFVETVKNIGNFRSGEVVDIEYQKTPECRHIQVLTPDCGACTQLYDFSDKVLVRYYVEEMAEQVIAAGKDKQLFDRGATVEFVGGDQIRLYFSGYILPRL